MSISIIMENFKEMTKRDAQISLNQELLKLRKTSNLTQEKNELIDKELEGFQRLFGQYLAADVAAQFMISASVCWRRMVDWRSLMHKLNLFTTVFPVALINHSQVLFGLVPMN